MRCYTTNHRIGKRNSQKNGIAINFKHVVVRTPEKAKEYRLIGSPTVQIEGLDIEPEARDIEQFGIT